MSTTPYALIVNTHFTTNTSRESYVDAAKVGAEAPGATLEVNQIETPYAKAEAAAEELANEVEKTAEEVEAKIPAEKEKLKKEVEKAKKKAAEVGEKIKKEFEHTEEAAANIFEHVAKAVSEAAASLSAAAGAHAKNIAELLSNPVVAVQSVLTISALGCVFGHYANGHRLLEGKSDKAIVVSALGAAGLIALDVVLFRKYYPKFDKSK